MWKKSGSSVYKKFKLKNTEEAMEIVQKIGVIAKLQGVVPRIQCEGVNVEVWLNDSKNQNLINKNKAVMFEIDQITGGKDPKTLQLPQQVKIFTDGGSRGNPGPSALGYVITDMSDKVLVENGVYLGITTNNQAEYQAVKVAMDIAYKMGAREAQMFMDSLLVVNQLKGIFKVKNRDLWPIYESILNQSKKYKKITFTHVPREYNKLADAEVNKVLDSEKL